MVGEIIGAGLCDDPPKCSVLSFAMSMSATGGIIYRLWSDGAAQDSKLKSQRTSTILNGVYQLLIDNNINVYLNIIVKKVHYNLDTQSFQVTTENGTTFQSKYDLLRLDVDWRYTMKGCYANATRCVHRNVWKHLQLHHVAFKY